MDNLDRLDSRQKRQSVYLKWSEGDRASDVELQKLAQRLVKPDGEAWEEGELVDIRLAEDLKRRRQERQSR
jgi:hypothetical protein